VDLNTSRAVQFGEVSFHLSGKTFSSIILVYELSLPSGFLFWRRMETLGRMFTIKSDFSQ